MIHSKVLLQAHSISKDIDFYFYLSSLAKILMPLGLFCYSEPKLLTNFDVKSNIKASNFLLFKFVKQNYRTRWVFLLFLNLLIYKKKFCFLPLVFSLFYEKPNTRKISLKTIEVKLHNNDLRNTSYDVVIPTIGRKKYLFNFLNDLNQQTLLPQNVIIVEQNPIENSISELDFVINENWKFNIKPIFTHQSGVCNARNLALQEIESEWVFFADDDVRIEPSFINLTLDEIANYDANIVTLRCHLQSEKKLYNNVFQWINFGSGCSFAKFSTIKKIKFDMGFEFGFGEDADFGMQLRNQGHDILYLPEPSILHLKAPIGGFRTKPVLAWHQDTIQPKPSPTVMLYKIKHDTKEQILGYKTILFFKFYNHQKIKNPIRYLSKFQKQWKQSIFWANELKRKNS
jgi:GT2 family glycosyltransferase